MSATPPNSPQALTPEAKAELSIELKRQAQSLFERTEVKRSEFMNLGKAHKEELLAAMAVEAQVRRARDLAIARIEKARVEREAAEQAATQAEAQLAQMRAWHEAVVHSVAEAEQKFNQEAASLAHTQSQLKILGADALKALSQSQSQSLRLLTAPNADKLRLAQDAQTTATEIAELDARVRQLKEQRERILRERDEVHEAVRSAERERDAARGAPAAAQKPGLTQSLRTLAESYRPEPAVA